MKSILRSFLDRAFAGLARQSDLDRLYDQLSGLQQIASAMAGNPVLRHLRGWAISPDAMAVVLSELQTYQNPSVVEFGSGQSTVILAAALRHRGGSLTSIEHDAGYLATIQAQVSACGLSDYVQFLHCPVENHKDDPRISSYDTEAIPEQLIDLALIDGPPTVCGPLSRLPPLRWALKCIKPSNGKVFLDDASREQERACLTKLSSEISALKILYHKTEKGLAELRIDAT